MKVGWSVLLLLYKPKSEWMINVTSIVRKDSVNFIFYKLIQLFAQKWYIIIEHGTASAWPSLGNYQTNLMRYTLCLWTQHIYWNINILYIYLVCIFNSAVCIRVSSLLLYWCVLFWEIIKTTDLSSTIIITVIMAKHIQSTRISVFIQKHSKLP